MQPQLREISARLKEKRRNKQEMKLQRLAMERDVQEKKQTLERTMKEKRLQVKMERIRLTGTSNESPEETK